MNAHSACHGGRTCSEKRSSTALVIAVLLLFDFSSTDIPFQYYRDFLGAIYPSLNAIRRFTSGSK